MPVDRCRPPGRRGEAQAEDLGARGGESEIPLVRIGVVDGHRRPGASSAGLPAAGRFGVSVAQPPPGPGRGPHCRRSGRRTCPGAPAIRAAPARRRPRSAGPWPPRSPPGSSSSRRGRQPSARWRWSTPSSTAGQHRVVDPELVDPVERRWRWAGSRGTGRTASSVVPMPTSDEPTAACSWRTAGVGSERGRRGRPPRGPHDHEEDRLEDDEEAGCDPRGSSTSARSARRPERTTPSAPVPSRPGPPTPARHRPGDGPDEAVRAQSSPDPLATQMITDTRPAEANAMPATRITGSAGPSGQGRQPHRRQHGDRELRRSRTSGEADGPKTRQRVEDRDHRRDERGDRGRAATTIRATTPGLRRWKATPTRARMSATTPR